MPSGLPKPLEVPTPLEGAASHARRDSTQTMRAFITHLTAFHLPFCWPDANLRTPVQGRKRRRQGLDGLFFVTGLGSPEACAAAAPPSVSSSLYLFSQPPRDLRWWNVVYTLVVRR